MCGNQLGALVALRTVHGYAGIPWRPGVGTRTTYLLSAFAHFGSGWGRDRLFFCRDPLDSAKMYEIWNMILKVATIDPIFVKEGGERDEPGA